jgi:glutamate dehydrogenase (NAD(P)+)
MAWFMDTYSQQVGHAVPSIVTGKPPVLGGTEARQPATGRGTVYVIQATLDRLGWRLEGKRVVIQGFGNVGSVVARELHALGARVTAVSDHTSGIVRQNGLDVPAIADWVDANGFLDGCPHGQAVGPQEVLEVPCDVLVPAAIEQQITAENADRLDCRLIVEAANGPTTPEAEEILAARRIPVVPDILANAGGVVVSYFEWVQDQQKYMWTVDQITERLRLQLAEATARVAEEAERRSLDWRTAAMAVAVERVARAAKLRGIYP